MKITQTQPPKHIYDKCVELFGVSFDNVCFTVGDTIHTKVDLAEHVVAHEKIHIKQQKAYGVDEWWDRYLIDDRFRYEQELEAYRAQWKFIKKNVKSRDDQAKLLRAIAIDLSGTMYGSIVSYQEALIRIQNG